MCCLTRVSSVSDLTREPTEYIEQEDWHMGDGRWYMKGVRHRFSTSYLRVVL